MEKISIILTNRNTKDYLDLAIRSIYNNNRDVINAGGEVIVLDDNSTDGSQEMLKKWEKKLGESFTWVSHNHSDRLGLMILNEAGIFFAENELIFLGHSDMYYGKNCIANLEKYVDYEKVICSTRIEPPIYADEPIRYQRDFGETPSVFKEVEFNQEVESLKVDRLTEGVFAPILMYKGDFCGYDAQFLPQSREDSRLFYQMAEQSVKFFQSWSSLVYHFSGKGSRKKDSLSDSDEWQKSNYKNERNFIRIYKELPNHLNCQPNIKEKPKITLCVATYKDESRIYNFLQQVEPFFDEIVIALDNNKEDDTLGAIKSYITDEKEVCETFSSAKIKFVKIDFKNDYSELRNTMQEQATNEWVFHADPDEELPTNLLLNLRNIISKSRDIKVFGFERLNYLEGVLVNDLPRNKWNKKDLGAIKDEYTKQQR